MELMWSALQARRLFSYLLPARGCGSPWTCMLHCCATAGQPLPCWWPAPGGRPGTGTLETSRHRDMKASSYARQRNRRGHSPQTPRGETPQRGKQPTGEPHPPTHLLSFCLLSMQLLLCNIYLYTGTGTKRSTITKNIFWKMQIIIK